MPFSPELDESMQSFLDLMKEEHTLYLSVFEKAKMERAAIEELDMDALRCIIEEKQKLLDRAATIELRVSDLRKVWREAKDFIRKALSDEIEKFLNTFSGCMKKLVEYENENEQIFIVKNEEKERDLGKLRVAKRASKAYFQTPQDVVKRRTDIKG